MTEKDKILGDDCIYNDQRTEDGRQKTEDRRPETEDRRRKWEEKYRKRLNKIALTT